MELGRAGVYVVIVFAAAFILWFFAGAALTRRRLAATARWVYQGLDLFGGRDGERSPASIKWLSTNAFSIVVERPRPPLEAASITVLLKSRDMLTVWLFDRLTGRRDLVMLRLDLTRQPIWGAELFRPRGILAGDGRRAAAEEGWAVDSAGEPPLLIAHGGGRAGELCRELGDALGPDRDRVVRLAVRRRSPHLILALDLPDPSSADPYASFRLARRLAEITLRYCTT